MAQKQSEVIEGTEREFLKIFESLCYSRSRWQVWEDVIYAIACSLSNSVDHTGKQFQKREEEYARCIKNIGSIDVASRLFAIIVMTYEHNPNQDFLGKMYMQLNLGSHWHGQFFTPYDVCLAMAKITIDNGASEEIKKRGWISVNDPACGAGATLIAAANVMHENGINYQRDVLFVGQDIDRVVGLMCYIQLSLLGCPGYVAIANTLSNPLCGSPLQPVEKESQEFWYTPFYFRNEWSIRRLGESLGLLKICKQEKPKQIDISEKYFFYFDFEKEESYGNHS